ncbi:presenilins-associated rhomboid-like protein, mitochondrial [Varroa jacobsoni]|uniref:rhomboid protease n=1 Tax=Varroa destructor TaxID=109461 RepID=A0A7M7JLE7_VARDE|nr:presenilins-associated rhomboid-like protein, mitochondrial [Varroa destructor]XP_022696890.1 presenilins-associated rhomboid-like protein, mitochondrial [Varroa jacobsoni]
MWRSSLHLTRKQLLYQRREFIKRQNLPNREIPVKAVPRLASNSGVGIKKAVAFTVGSTCTFYAGATIYTYEYHVTLQQKLQERTRLQWSQIQPKAISIRRQINEWWRNQSPGHKAFFGIFALNAAVLILWHVPQLAHIMPRYFCHSVSSRNVVTMLLSTFSHSSLLHFGCNMFVLHSFSDAILKIMDQQQFVATYLSSGVIASLATHLHQSYTKIPIPSLGASGAILGIVGIVCVRMPDMSLCLVFLPMLTFSAGTAIKALLAFDTLGLCLRWRFFDHAAHLGGALFGVVYAMGGAKFIIERQRQFFDRWRDFRTK